MSKTDKLAIGISLAVLIFCSALVYQATFYNNEIKQDRIEIPKNIKIECSIRLSYFDSTIMDTVWEWKDIEYSDLIRDLSE